VAIPPLLSSLCTPVTAIRISEHRFAIVLWRIQVRHFLGQPLKQRRPEVHAMFDFVREHTRLALGFLLLLIIPSFVFFGVQGYSRFTDGSGTAVAKVDGKGISRNEWDDAHRRNVDMARRQSPNIDPSKLDNPEARRETLDGLLRERVLLAAANQLHLFPAPARMVRLFDSDPQFAGLRGPDGKLNREVLAMQGMTAEVFDQRLRQDLGTRQVLGGITQTVPAPVLATSTALDAFFQRREVQVQPFVAAALRAKLTPSDAEVEAFYKANEAKFKAPEQAGIEYVVLDLATLSKAIPVSDDDLRKAYSGAAARFTTPEERRASHILIQAGKDKPAAERAAAKARAEALLAEVRKAPATFADVARKNSQDAGSAVKGGELDFFGKDQMVKPFEDKAFAMKVGDISDIVETDFGFHIITLTGVRGGEVKPFEAVRAELEAELRKSAAQKTWAASAEQFTNMVYEQSDSLQPAIDKLKLVKQTASVARSAAVGASGPLASTKLLDAVFNSEALKAKRNTDAIETGPNQLVSARVLQHQPARVLSLAEVKEQAREALITEQALALARKDGQARLLALQGGATDGLPPAVVVARNNSQGLPPPVLDAVLRADTSKLPMAVGVDLPGQGYAVVRVTQVLAREPAPANTEDSLRTQYAQAWGQAESDAYLAALKKRFKVEIKPEATSAVSAGAAASGAAR
jgi:peptidyl-prolyl cis-trans isomerase D